LAFLRFLQRRDLIGERRAGLVLPRYLLFIQTKQADASGEGNGDSNRAQREAGFIAAVFLSVFSGCGVLSTASLVSSTTAD
jgi:hypothetical protein